MENTGKQFRKRNAVLSCLRQSKAHPSAEALYECVRRENPDISLATVYRNLTWFKEQGLIISLGTVNGVERFDGCVEPHVHFACRQCGSVMDVPRVEIPDSISHATSAALDCRVENAHLMLTGICKDCIPADKEQVG